MAVSFYTILFSGHCTVGHSVIVDNRLIEYSVTFRINQFIMRLIAASYPDVNNICRMWFSFQATMTQILSCSIDLILMIRGRSAYSPPTFTITHYLFTESPRTL